MKETVKNGRVKKRRIIRTDTIWEMLKAISASVVVVGWIIFAHLVFISSDITFLIFTNSIACLFLLGCILSLLYSFQLAIINSEGIIMIRHLFCKIGFITWDEISNVTVEYNTSSFHREEGITIPSLYEWIVIYDEKIQTEHIEDRDKKSKPPWLIVKSKRNVKIMVEYLNKYRPDINTENIEKVAKTKRKR